MKPRDLTGQKFGRLTAIELAGRNKYGRALWLCKCDCGESKVVDSNSLKQGGTRSCGCLDKEQHQNNPNRETHGSANTRLYRIWKKMKSRCHNPNDPDYKKYYGVNGVSVCEEWRTDFTSFYNWAMANGYTESLSIDRIDPAGNYTPSNCRWADAVTQANNKRNKPLKGGGSH